MKKIVLLGASGSIGIQTVDVVKNHPEAFEIVALSIGKNIASLRTILQDVHPVKVCVGDASEISVLQEEYPSISFVSGDEGLVDLVQTSQYDVLVNALVGFVGFTPTLKAIEAHKDIALANKETLVVAGKIINDACEKNGVKLYPIDSEHSAIFQALQGNKKSEVKNLIITASGGSFRDLSREELKNVTVAQALAHPNWSMGAKITIDSATMMNKGFEVIEAYWLFGIDFDHIQVLMHTESVIHSMVQYIDNSVMAQCATADMRLPIQYALSYPDRMELCHSEPLDLAKIATLHFREVSFERYPLLALAYEVGRKQGNLPAIMNGANEVANSAFRDGKISFLDIETLVIEACHTAKFKEIKTLEDLYEADAWARKFVQDKIEEK